VFDVFDFEMIREKLDYLFSGEVIPRGAVHIAEADHEVGAILFQDSVNAPYEGASVLHLYVMKATHVEDEIEIFVFEGEV
jgi:hypothetical protein